MSISVTEPIERAWNRMVEMLFKPFDPASGSGLGFFPWRTLAEAVAEN